MATASRFWDPLPSFIPLGLGMMAAFLLLPLGGSGCPFVWSYNWSHCEELLLELS